MNDGAWVLLAPAPALPALAPLVAAHAATREVRVMTADVPPARWQDRVPAGAAGVLLVGTRRRSPQTVLPGLFVPDADGAPVPAGWLPVTSQLPLAIATAARVLGRTTPAPVAVLGQREARYLHLADRLEHHLGATNVVRWTAERVTREDLLQGLGGGLGLAVYLGHGRPGGWAAYRGLRAEHLSAAALDAPLGALLSVTCWTASRWRVGLSFAESVVVAGAAAASLGAVRPVLHLDSVRLVVRLAAVLRTAPAQLGTLLRRALVDGGQVEMLASQYRLCGDPLAPLSGEPGAAARAHALYAPAPDEQLVAS